MSAFQEKVNALRDELSVFAAADEDERVTSAAAKLEIAIFNTHNRVSWHVADLLRHSDSGESYGLARAEHLRAQVLVRIVLDLVRGAERRQAGGNASPPRHRLRRGRLSG